MMMTFLDFIMIFTVAVYYNGNFSVKYEYFQLEYHYHDHTFN